jgi:photosystem II stability/assembly factor-like uncharacterized protein
MISAMRAVAVGDGGEIWTTDDGGASWTFRDAGTTDDLYDVAFVDEDTGIAVGDNGRKRHTSDGGINWTAGVTGSGTVELLRGVSYGSPTTLVIVGANGAIRRSTNGGQLWGDFSANIPDSYYTDVAMLDESTVLVLGYGASAQLPVYRTTDRGDTWETIELFAGLPETGAMSFADDRTGFVATRNGDVYITDDGGATWKQEPAVGQNYNGVCAISNNLATIVGNTGTIVRVER